MNRPKHLKEHYIKAYKNVNNNQDAQFLRRVLKSDYSVCICPNCDTATEDSICPNCGTKIR